MGINTLVFRMCQHNSFYSVDADCVGITQHVDWNKNRQWLDVLSKSGTPLFVSIAENAYSEQVKKEITIAFENINKCKNPSQPIDWMVNEYHRIRKSDFGKDEYNWD